eukprot:g6533.t1
MDFNEYSDEDVADIPEHFPDSNVPAFSKAASVVANKLPPTIDAAPQIASMLDSTTSGIIGLGGSGIVGRHHHFTTDDKTGQKMLSSTAQLIALTNEHNKLVTNPKAAVINHPLQGPRQKGVENQDLEMKRLKNHHMGLLETTHMSAFAFDDAMLSWDKYGKSSHALYEKKYQFGGSRGSKDQVEVAGEAAGAKIEAGLGEDVNVGVEGEAGGANGGHGADHVGANKKNPLINTDIWGDSALGERRGKRKLIEEDGGRKRIRNDDAADTENFKGPWASFEGEADRKDYWTKQMEEIKSDADRVAEEQQIQKQSGQNITKIAETSRFYGKQEYDYQGRSWLVNKTSQGNDTAKRSHEERMENDETWCYLPKKCVHTFTGHTQGVQCIRLFPGQNNSGHLLLSAGLDATIKIWDIHNQRQCLRDYMGHDVGVRDVKFTSDGSRFYSCSFDKNINLWDTETGKIISTMTNNKTPYCLAVHPDVRKQNIFIAGCSNKKAVEWDANSGKIVQEYDEHLGTVNSVTFCDEGKKILTTSDDKKIFIWEYGIPIVCKYISEPSMHSIPTVAVSPRYSDGKKYLIGQSLDNKIVVYEAGGRFKFQGHRKFQGHMSAGFACEVAFSPDGQFVTSGDGNGKLWFWGWKNQRNYKTIQNAHGNLPCISCVWHPKMTSRVFTCGYDGLIRMWD